MPSTPSTCAGWNPFSAASERMSLRGLRRPQVLSGRDAVDHHGLLGPAAGRLSRVIVV